MQIFHLFCIKKKKKTYFFYFTHLILQNTHINLSILHIYLIKYSLFYHFFIIFFIVSLFLSDPTTIIITTSIGEPFKIKTTKDQKIIQHQKPIQAETHSIRKPNHHPPNLKPTNQTTRNKRVDRRQFDQASCGSGLMLIGGSGLMLIK